MASIFDQPGIILKDPAPAAGMQQMPATPRPAVSGVQPRPAVLPNTPSPAATNLAAGVNMVRDMGSIPLDTIRAVGKTVAQAPRFAMAPVVDTALNLGASAFGGKRQDPSYYTGAAYEDMANAASGITKPISEGFKNLSENVRGFYGLSPADQPAVTKPTANPAPAPAVQTKAERDAMLANPTVNPALNQEPRMMARQAEEYTPAARNPMRDYLDALTSQSSENAAIRAQALQDLQDAKNLDTSSVGNMIVSAAKGRRKGMAAKAVLGNVEAMDPNKFISPVVQQGMQSEASKYTADTGAAASRFTAQASAAEKAQDRALKAGLEGPKAAQEAMLTRMLAQSGGDLTKIGNISSAFKGMGDTYQGVVDQNTGMISAVGTKGSQAGNVFVGGKSVADEQAKWTGHQQALAGKTGPEVAAYLQQNPEAVTLAQKYLPTKK
jgi:hypothetical protein